MITLDSSAPILNIDVEINYGTIDLTQDSDAITLEESDAKKLIDFAMDDLSNQEVRFNNVILRKSLPTYVLEIRKDDTTSIFFTSHDMVDQFVDYLIDMGIK
jgi:hypothetical protein